MGVYSRLAKLDSEVRDGDRIEIYRPLVADPKEIRRRRAEKAKMDGKADPVTGGKLNRFDGKTGSNPTGYLTRFTPGFLCRQKTRRGHPVCQPGKCEKPRYRL